MGEYILELSEEGRHLSAYKGFLKVSAKGKELGRLPCADIESVMLTAHSCTVTKKALSKMAAEGIIGIVCGDNFMPISMIFPISAHFQSSGVMRDQINAKRPLCKRIWQTLVRGKIANQAAMLEKCIESSPSAARLKAIENKVRSGDSTNMEGQAARLYWKALFGELFVRDSSADGINVLLNYAYAILRSVVARAICTAGLSPAIGIHHKNRNNPFCLVDDLMEPFRPFADQIVFATVNGDAQWDGEMTPSVKRELTAIIDAPSLLEGQSSSLQSAARRMAQLLADSFQVGENKILIPVA